MAEKKTPEGKAEDGVVIIKKYANRRLYNTATSAYVTLDDLARMVRDGTEFQVFDAKSIPGGKARTIPVPGSGVAGRRDLPGEHGFRFFPSFYEHLPDSMARIPFGPDGATCADYGDGILKLL